MKKILAIFIALSFILASSGFAAENIGFKNKKRDGGFSYLEWTIVTATDGSLTKTAAEKPICGLIYGVQVIPDATTPFTTDTTDILITDPRGVNITGTQLNNIVNTATTNAYTVFNSASMDYPIDGLLSVDITGNSVNSGACVIRVYYIRCEGNR